MRGFDMSAIEKDPQASAIALYAHWNAFILAKDGKTLTKSHDGPCFRFEIARLAWLCLPN